jgi:hypothetical protein
MLSWKKEWRNIKLIGGVFLCSFYLTHNVLRRVVRMQQLTMDTFL